MKPIDIDPIIKAIEARQDNAEDLPPLTTGDFLRMLREASEQKEVLKIMETAAELRKPHGALIDRDALKNIKFTDVNHDYRLGWNEAIEAIMENADVVIEGSEENV